eukprot:CAMPEP_0184648536 /NCGR_PEP_ID=MMETSP0308-20130426/5679_1 /TAXON_ID=38269 /ORGANISM="Gloeochaete witrockiana, Strain SAG 46.84" /LENGTH=34 /DNA_ID= /DNA_START= /DNA_END= /DNA_ORIENTATION=
MALCFFPSDSYIILPSPPMKNLQQHALCGIALEV